MSSTDRQARGLPYLHRNWMAAVNHWQSTGAKTTRDKSLDRHDDQCHRPVKRRRLGENSPSSMTEVGDLDGFLLPGDRDQVEKALRIEVLKIDHKDSSRVKFSTIFNGLIPPQVKDVVNSKARCRISICCQRNGERMILHVDSQICTIKTFKNPVGPSRTSRIYLPQPFHVPQEKILIVREDDDVFSLADSYTLLIELESAGDPNWPPLKLASLHDDEQVFYNGSSQSRQWVLSASISEVFNRNRKAVALRLKKKRPQHEMPTDYVLDVDVRWTSGLSSSWMARRLEKDVMPSITVLDPSEVPPPDPPTSNGAVGVNGVNGYVNGSLLNGNAETTRLTNGHVNGDVLDDAEEQAEGELTPGRSRRARHQINYNLKLLSDQAAGKERRRRRKAEGKTDHGDECRITYLLPPEQFSVDDFSCCLCGAPHQSVSQLRAHLLGHDKYGFNFDVRPKGGYHVSVAHTRKAASSPLRSKVYQLGRPLKPFDLEKFVDGDDSWITSRFGPDNDRDLGPAKPVAPKITAITATKRTKKKALVPHIKQPLFDPLSKVQLEPGSEIRPYYADSSWLIQKHNDMLQDFVDIEAEEKEYIRVWDGHIMKLHLTSEQYLPREFLSFIKQKAQWIAAKPSRAHEFSKHVLVLYARNAIDEGVINTAMQYLNEARSQKPLEEPKTSPKQKLANGCAVCGQLVAGPSYLVCSEFSCKKRLYHDYCVKDPKIPVEERDFWKCNSCAG